MRTSPLTNNSTNVTPELEADLAAYGIVRKTAMKEAAPRKGTQTFFGIRENGDSTELKFGADIATLQDEGMTVAMVAPENETFNMLLSTNFNRAVTEADPETLRDYLRNLLRKV